MAVMYVANHLNVRATLLLVAVWFVVFAIPMFLWVKQRTVAVKTVGNPLKLGFTRLFETIRHARHYKEAGKLLAAGLSTGAIADVLPCVADETIRTPWLAGRLTEELRRGHARPSPSSTMARMAKSASTSRVTEDGAEPAG